MCIEEKLVDYKNLSDEQVLNTLRIAQINGLKGMKIYTMIGLPTESDEDIEQMSEQFMDLMSVDEDADDSALNDETFDLGTAPAMPFLKNIFGNLGGEKTEAKDEKEPKDKKGDSSKKKRRRFMEQYCTNLSDKARQGKIDVIIGRDKELYKHCEGIISNVMEFAECSKIPLMTIADYLWTGLSKHDMLSM